MRRYLRQLPKAVYYTLNYFHEPITGSKNIIFMHIKIITIFIISVFVIQGCSTSVTKPTAPIKTGQSERDPNIDIVTNQTSADDLLEQAKQASSNDATILLLQAARQYLNESEPEKSLFISYELRKLELNESIANYNDLNVAIALYQLGEYELAADVLPKQKATATITNQTELRFRSDLNLKRGLLVEGLAQKLTYMTTYKSTSKEDIYEVYHKFSKLKPWQLKAISKKNVPQLSGWLDLIKKIDTYGSDTQRLEVQLINWQHTYSNHMANALLNDVLVTAKTLATHPKAKNIVVAIPLSGREKSLGKTLQAGILAAYTKSPKVTIQFIDTNAKQMADTIIDIANLNPDFVIGPLLKQHVSSYLGIINQQNSTSDTDMTESDMTESISNTPYAWSSILLNLPENAPLKDNQYALSMLPEDEAIQAAFSISKKGYKKALVLTQDSAIGKRMASSFAEQWQLQTGVDASLIYYPNNNKMQVAVKSGLDVNLSEERISILKRRLKENLKTETRNRRDVDVIYIFATPNQAKLLKPYVDVNISPFAETIPIFASSRSNSDSNDNVTRRDLNGLTFTEIPWLLTAKQVNPSLSQEARELWPNRKSSLERLYAMGIDSYQLVDNVERMRVLPMAKHNGETGVLQMGSNQIISRSLSWGRYRSARVQSVEMD